MLARPRTFPSGLVVENGSKIFLVHSSGTPHPLSRMETPGNI